MKRQNRLKKEISLYLLQHAANPVAWHPWNDETFIEAKELDKAVFLSIGYSTCHWCHVMARECFVVEEVARAMNDASVCIKVDREELPHIDAVYMSVCRMMTGSAGWPLTIIMTPDKQPFFTATYLPKHSRQGLIGMDEKTFYERLEQLRKILFERRSMRAKPFTDDLILTDWNGLMIAALARTGQALGQSEYIHAAKSSADFILDNMTDAHGHLLHMHRAGKSCGEANSSDYAFFIWGLIELYEADFDMKYLDSAAALTRRCIEHYWDENGGGIYLTPARSDAVITRIKESQDLALPSNNSVFLLDLILLSRITGDADLEQKAWEIVHAFSRSMTTNPSSHMFMLLGLDLLLGPTCEVALSVGMDKEDGKEKLHALRSRFLPHVVVVQRPEKPTGALPEHIRDIVPQGKKTTVYVCSKRTCNAPITDTKEMMRLVMSPN